MRESEQTRRTSEEDRATESAVLLQVLALHPSPLSVDELVREVGGEDESFDCRDAVERAVRDLTACGLLHRNDRLVLASRAAVRFDELLGA